MTMNPKIVLVLFIAAFFAFQDMNKAYKAGDNEHNNCVSISLKETSSSPLDTIDNGRIEIKVATYNLRYNALEDTNLCNGWDIRKYPMARLIQDNDIDIIGAQEANFQQMDELIDLLPGYAYIGNPYGGSDGQIHTASIIYRKSAFEIVEHGKFWYSPTPNVKSIGWDATDLRICTWAKMKYKPSGQEFYFFTSHFYWRYHTAKEHSGKVMVKMIKKIITNNDLPVISTGDLNSVSSSSQIQDILSFFEDAYNIVKTPRLGPVNTNLGGGNFKGTPINRIDYVFVNDKVQVSSYATLNKTYNKGRYPSDHLPVVCDLFLEY